MMTAKQPKTKHVSITFYNDRIVTEFHTTDSVEGELVSPYDTPGNMGFVVLDLDHVGISQEAYNALQRVRRGNSGLGDFDIFKSGVAKGQQHNYVLGVLGGAYGVRKVESIEASRDWVLPDISAFQLISNDVPQGAIDAIDNPSTEEDDDE